MTSTVVLGGTGYIGRQICEAFLALGHRVLVLARDPAKAPPGTRGKSVDLVNTDPRALAGLLTDEGCDVIVNAAGGVWVSDEERYRLNVTLVENLLVATTVLDRRPRLVHLGSAHEYKEFPPGSPLAVYAASKHQATKLVVAATERGALDGVVLRLASVLGPHPAASGLLETVIPRLRDAKASGQSAVLYVESPHACRDFIDVRDVADAVTAATVHRASGVIDVGGGRVVLVRELLELLVKISGAPAEIIVRDAGGRASTEERCLDITTAEALLDWRPQRTLEQTLASAWSAYTGKGMVRE
ncbi:NAD-dependent epimerase/dehydratase family protein [Kitasatospora sp. NBC_01302]|uniref:NAD-dependent epimerase/dehydratase family protein n=1 Tax=Kitasatospora sp. NBC_01302 TaxID=2903575 RepID=UPI002E0E53CD|nr:NAD(P)-dependent oxidoreductase [Kitasatospora sp. NBC_01302]